MQINLTNAHPQGAPLAKQQSVSPIATQQNKSISRKANDFSIALVSIVKKAKRKISLLNAIWVILKEDNETCLESILLR